MTAELTGQRGLHREPPRTDDLQPLPYRLAVPVALGVGGAFDFLAGRRRRAPLLLRRAHLEWLWRLALEPWRARRMAVLPLYALAVLRSSHP